MTLKHLDNWIFKKQPSQGEFFASLLFVKYLRLVEEHYQTQPENFANIRSKEV